MMAAGEILGIGNYYFFDQIDDYYNRNENRISKAKTGTSAT